MIKFVCASCGERLSVPDQHGGRKGLCPICQGVNRIPLKGYAETQPSSPTIARTAPVSAQTPVKDREIPQPASIPPRQLETPAKPASVSDEQKFAANAPRLGPITMNPAAEIAVGTTGDKASISPAVVSVTSPAAYSSAVSPDRFTSPTKFIAPPDDAANLRAMRRARQEATRTTPPPDSQQLSVKERQLPRKLKIALLILAAVAIAASLWFGLLWALNTALTAMQPPK